MASNIIQLFPDPLSVEETLSIPTDANAVVVIAVYEEGVAVIPSGKPSFYEIVGLLDVAKQAFIDQIKEER